MMSPAPPPQPPRSLPPSTAAMAESARPFHSLAFPHLHHLPPPPLHFGNSPVTAPPSFSGLILAPIDITGPGFNLNRSKSGSGGSTPPRHHSVLQQPGLAYAPSPHHDQQLPLHQLHQSPASVTHPHPHADVRTNSPFGRPPPSHLTTFALPTAPTFPSAPPYDSAYDSRYSRESDDCRRSSLSTMVPSPTFAGQMTSSEDNGSGSYSSGFSLPPVADESGCSALLDAPPPGRNQGGNYKLRVRQQPAAARACGFGERDRRVIDPPPIVKLTIKNPVTGLPDSNEIRYPFNVMHCTLWSEDGTTDETALTGADKRITRRLMGTLVSSPFVGLDEDGNEGCFFCFPDLSCRTHGKYRLRFVLMRLEPSDLQPEGYTPVITQCMSDVFTVYTAKEFPGMRASTYLTKALKRQGCAISVKKGNEKPVEQAGGSGKDDESGNEDAATDTKRRRKT